MRLARYEIFQTGEKRVESDPSLLVSKQLHARKRWLLKIICETPHSLRSAVAGRGGGEAQSVNKPEGITPPLRATRISLAKS